jgi:hypothetical protein
MAKPGRNDPCPCGSGRKYKKCHEPKEREANSRVMLFVVGGALAAALVAGIVSFTGRGSSGTTRIWSPEHGHYHDANGVAVP